jgi:serine/threonine protein kinase
MKYIELKSKIYFLHENRFTKRNNYFEFEILGKTYKISNLKFHIHSNFHIIDNQVIEQECTVFKKNETIENKIAKICIYHGNKLVVKYYKNSIPVPSGRLPGIIVKEISLLNMLKNSTYTPSLYQYTISDSNINLYMQLGSSTYNTIYPTHEKYILISMFRLIKILKNLQEYDILHGDIKHDNIVNLNYRASLIDWNLSKIGDISVRKSLQVQSLWFTAPEICYANLNNLNGEVNDGVIYDYKIDVFSLGLLFLALFLKSYIVMKNYMDEQAKQYMIVFLGKNANLLNTTHYIKKNLAEAMNMKTKDIIKDNLKKYKQIPEKYLDIISGMLEFNPSLRSTYEELIIDPVFQNPIMEKRERLPRIRNRHMPHIENIHNFWNDPRQRNFIFMKLKNIFDSSKFVNKETLLLSFQLLDLLAMKKIDPSKCYLNCLSLSAKIYEPYNCEKFDINFLSVDSEEFSNTISENEIFSIFEGCILYKILNVKNVPNYIDFYLQSNVYSKKLRH